MQYLSQFLHPAGEVITIYKYHETFDAEIQLEIDS